MTFASREGTGDAVSRGLVREGCKGEGREGQAAGGGGPLPVDTEVFNWKCTEIILHTYLITSM